MIELSGLTKTFGPVRAVDGLSLTVSKGEVLGFLGPNGAGKTTTMRMVTGYLPPSAGTIRVCGHDAVSEPTAVRARIGYLPEGAPLYGDMTPAGLLNFVGAMRGFSGAARDERIAQAVSMLGLGDMLHRPIETLSKGYKRRVGLAQAVLHDPEVLILDEPTDGLDPNQKGQVRDLIQRMAADKAIIISTHILEEVEAVCNRTVIIARGQIVFDGAPADLERRSDRYNAVTVRAAADQAPQLESILAEAPGVTRTECRPGMDGAVAVTAIPERGRFILHDVAGHLQARGVPVDEIRTEGGDLAKVFQELTLGAA